MNTLDAATIVLVLGHNTDLQPYEQAALDEARTVLDNAADEAVAMHAALERAKKGA